MEIKGRIHLIGKTESLGKDGTFLKRTMVIETPEQYPQKLAVEFIKDKTDLLDKYMVGQDVTVSVNLRGSEYNGRFYVSLQGWKIDGGGAKAKTSTPINEPIADDGDGLPF
jgi:hypothetical protein